MIIKPNKLCLGDKVAVIAPSSPAKEELVAKGERMLRALGLEPVMYPSCYMKYGYLSGPDDKRAKDIVDAFCDPSIKGIVCLRGGYGTPRILNMLDYEQIKRNPKVFIGYSDITGLHIAFNKLCNMVTYHGFMATSSIYKKKGDRFKFESYTIESINKNLFTNEAIGEFQNPPGEDMRSLYDGLAQGELIGGNLSLLAATLGSQYEIDTKGKILFIEDTGEAVYRIDRMLTSLALAHKFDDCSGIILGTWTDCPPKVDCEDDLPIMDVFREILLPYKKPVITNFRAGHNSPQPVIAFGTKVIMDSSNKKIIFTESGNKD